MFYEPEYHADGTLAAMNRTRSDVPREVLACTIKQDFDAIPLPTRPIVPFVQTPHDRIAIEIMRGCPWQCRFCQSTVIKRPLRVRSVETIVQAALESYRNTGYDEISLLSLSTSDYPYFEELVKRMHEVFDPLGVNISLPSLRINHQLRSLPKLMQGARKSGLTLAPEVARDDMREQIRKKIKNDDLYEGCREAFKNGWQRVKLYFLCGLPGERAVDLDGIVDMAEHISAIGKEVTRPLRRGDGVGVELRAQAAHALPVERHADARVSALGRPVPAPPVPAPRGAGQAARHRVQPAGRRPDARRPAHRAGPGGGLAARLPAGRLARVLPAGDVVADLRRPGHRHGLVLAAQPADDRGAAVGPRQRQEGARVPGEGTDPQSGATGGDGQRDIELRLGGQGRAQSGRRSQLSDAMHSLRGRCFLLVPTIGGDAVAARALGPVQIDICPVEEFFQIDRFLAIRGGNAQAHRERVHGFAKAEWVRATWARIRSAT